MGRQTGCEVEICNDIEQMSVGLAVLETSLYIKLEVLRECFRVYQMQQSTVMEVSS